MKKAEEMAKREKDRRGSRMVKFNAQRTIGLEELRGYCFAHGDHGSGSKFNKTVEKIAEYCQVEVCKEIYKLILYGEAPEFPEVEAPTGSRPGAVALRKYEMDYKRQLEKKEEYEKDKCKAFGIINNILN